MKLNLTSSWAHAIIRAMDMIYLELAIYLVYVSLNKQVGDLR
jgi:hypothetical protein